MRENEVKRKLQQGKPAFGTYAMEFYTPGLARILANAGAEFVILDCEHSGWSVESLRLQVALAHGAGLVPIVNTPAGDYERIGLFLDIGAMGLMVPHVESRAQAEELVRATRYPPAGVRGGGFGIAHDDYREDDVRETIRIADQRTLIIAKLESRKGVGNAEAIMEVPGIDVALVTSGDLSLDLGVPGEGSHPDILAALDRVLAICRAKNKTAGCAVFDVATGRARLAAGFRFIQYSWDIGLLGGALKDGLAALRQG
jgi:2-keto-3-deoxy-L-rhamnonate aldolase RhmA